MTVAARATTAQRGPPQPPRERGARGQRVSSSSWPESSVDQIACRYGAGPPPLHDAGRRASDQICASRRRGGRRCRSARRPSFLVGGRSRHRHHQRASIIAPKARAPRRAARGSAPTRACPSARRACANSSAGPRAEGARGAPECRSRCPPTRRGTSGCARDDAVAAMASPNSISSCCIYLIASTA